MLKVILLFFIIMICSCTGQNGRTEVTNQSDGHIYELSHNQPIMVFDTLIHDFGTLIEGEQVVCYFEYANEGDKELIIESIQSSCGCTTLEWNSEPLKSGDKSVLTVLFDSYGREGIQRKTITVNSNAENPVTRLTIRANIEVK